MTLTLTMPTLRPAEDLGAVLAGRSQASVLRAEVERLVALGEHVVIDFSGVVAASPSFADELFAKLDPSLTETGRVAFQHLSPRLEPIVRFVISNRHGALPA